ncbi:MAG: lysine--tRNA ligase, partial [Pseudomonadota bacterium]
MLHRHVHHPVAFGVQRQEDRIGLDTFGFEYEFVSAREFYRSGQFDEILLRCVERYDDLMKIMVKSL